MRFTAIILFICLTLGQSCGSNAAEQVDQLHDQVMVVHDEVMPKMSDINRAKQAIRAIENEALETQKNELIAQLDEADEAMMSWMHQYKKPSADNLEQATSYLNDQLTKITDVKNQMLTSIEKAQQFIESNQ